MSLAMELKASLPPPFPSVCKPHCVLDLLSQELEFSCLGEHRDLHLIFFAFLIHLEK
jgi:hypothetical protein